MTSLREFQQLYAKGRGLETLESRPEQPAELTSSEASTNEEWNAARRLFQTLGFAAPKPATESRRLRSLHRYALYDTMHHDMIQRIYRLAVRVVPEDSGVFLSLVGDEEQTIIAGAPEGRLRKGARIARDGGFCGHSLLSAQGIEIADTSADWRFANSPFVKDGTIGAYHGLPLRLRLDSDDSESDGDEPVAVGAFCVYSPTRRRSQTAFVDEKTRQILLDLAELVEFEFTRIVVQRRQAREAKLAERAEQFLAQSVARSPGDHDMLNPTLCNAICKDIVQMLECEVCYVLDMRGFLGQKEEALFISRRLLGYWSATEAQQDTLAALQARTSVTWQEGLGALAGTRHVIYNGSSVIQESALRHWTSSETTAFLAHSFVAPVADSQLIVIASTRQPYNYFSKADLGYVTSLGNIALDVSIRQQMQIAETERTSFIHRMSHEIRTPLHGLRSQIGLLALHSISLSSFLKTADVCSTMLEDMVDNILLFDDLRGQSVATLFPTSAINICEMTRCLVQLALERQSKLDGPAEYSDPAQTFLDVQVLDQDAQWNVRIDVSGFQRVLLALLLNAVKFTTSGSIIVSLRLEVIDGRHYCAVDVVDTGCGMSADFLRNSAFEPFVKENAYSQGIGLGLSIVESVVQRMDGQIVLGSVKGAGTTARVTLPVEAVSDPLPTAETLQAASSIRQQVYAASSEEYAKKTTPKGRLVHDKSTSSLGRTPSPESRQDFLTSPELAKATAILSINPDAIRVLAVDDNAIARRILKTLSVQVGANCREASNGEEALQIFKVFHPHIVLTDIAMPCMDGFEASVLMRQHEEQHQWTATRIVAISAYPEPPNVQPPFDQWCVKGKGDLSLIKQMLLDVQERTQNR